MTLDNAAMGEDDIDRMRKHFSEDQIVEITSVVGLFNYLNRFAVTMGLWPTRPGEGGPEESS